MTAHTMHPTYLPQNIYSMQDILRHQTQPIPLSEPYSSFFGKLPLDEQFTLFIYGEKGTRKTTLALPFAQELVQYTNRLCLYNSNEEPAKSHSGKLRLEMLDINDPRLHFINTQNSGELKAVLEKGTYKFCVIDSVDNLDIRSRAIIDMCQMLPEVSFILVGQVDKSGNQRSDNMLPHLAYAVYRTEYDAKNNTYSAILEKTRYNATAKHLSLDQSPSMKSTTRSRRSKKR